MHICAFTADVSAWTSSSFVTSPKRFSQKCHRSMVNNVALPLNNGPTDIMLFLPPSRPLAPLFPFVPSSVSLSNMWFPLWMIHSAAAATAQLSEDPYFGGCSNAVINVQTARCVQSPNRSPRSRAGVRIETYPLLRRVGRWFISIRNRCCKVLN